MPVVHTSYLQADGAWRHEQDCLTTFSYFAAKAPREATPMMLHHRSKIAFDGVIDLATPNHMHWP